MKLARLRASILPSCLLAGLLAVPALADAPATEAPMKHLGVFVDVGLPEGANASVVYRFIPFLRGELGLSTDFAKVGLRVAATASLRPRFLTPTATLSYGHLFDGQKGVLLEALVGHGGTAADTLKNISYDYVAGQVGLDIGPPNFIQGYVRVGLSYVSAVAHDYQPALQKAANDPTLEIADPVLRMVVPTASVGVILYVL